MMLYFLNICKKERKKKKMKVASRFMNITLKNCLIHHTKMVC